jgi:DNA-binding NtrC family response regulator
LRALQDGEIDPVGARRPIRVDFRMISATNKSLIDQVKEGRFREDLYYRLNVFPIRIPPLRERREDVAELVRHFAARFAAEEGKTALRGVDAEALELLAAYSWPGNIRQLENAVFARQCLPTADAHARRVSADRRTGVKPADRRRGQARAHPGTHHARLPSHRAPDRARSRHSRKGNNAHRRSRRISSASLWRIMGRMVLVAQVGIGRSTLYRKLKELNLVETDGIAAE